MCNERLLLLSCIDIIKLESTAVKSILYCFMCSTLLAVTEHVVLSRRTTCTAVLFVCVCGSSRTGKRFGMKAWSQLKSGFKPSLSGSGDVETCGLCSYDD